MLDRISDQTVQLAKDGILTLSHSEFKVLRGMLNGLSAEEIAKEIGLTKLTVQFYCKVILRRTRTNRIVLARIAYLLEEDPQVSRYAQQISGSRRSKRTGAEKQSAVAAVNVEARLASTHSDATSRLLRRRPFAVRRRSVPR